MSKQNVLYLISCIYLLVSCEIVDDIPYPIIDGEILSFEVEGQCAAPDSPNKDAVIDGKERTISLFVNDSVDLSRLKITRLQITEKAKLMADSVACEDFSNFPTKGFSSLNDVLSTTNTRVDFSEVVSFKVSTFQDYLWKISVKQLIDRQIDISNQVGNAIIDAEERSVVIYVSHDQPLDAIKVNKMNLGGAFGKVEPNPTAESEKDYSKGPRQFYVSHSWEDTMRKWEVFIYHKKDGETEDSEVFPMVTKANIKGKIQSGKTPVIEYKQQSDSNWSTLPSRGVKVSGTSFSASLTGLKANTSYLYRVSVDEKAGQEHSFTTVKALPLPNGNLDSWSLVDGKLYQPWADGEKPFWDTGNKGTTTVGESNSKPTDETCNGVGKAAVLESKYIVIKFAAGNIFTGKYKKTDGTNGVLDFGCPFSSFPSKLRINYKYKSELINKVGDEAVSHLKGRPDSCQIYIALTDWNTPLEIRTRPSERQLFNPKDPHVIAYGEMTRGNTTSSYQQEDIVLNYRYTNRTPKYILVVATSSKYGDFFTGGEGSKLWLDECELIYD